MAFDPDQYLAKANAGKPQGGGFDPDAYLAKQGKAPAQDSIQTAQAAPYSDDANPIKSALVGAGRLGLGAINTAARTIDRFTGAPTRAAIGAAQNADSLSDIVPDAISAGAHQFGRDPDQAPSGEDIVKRAGVPEGAASKVLGFSMDMAANPLNVMSLPGAAAKVGEMAEGAAPMIRSGVSKASEFMTGVPSEAIDRLIQRPAQVMVAENEGNALNVAKKARKEFQNTAENEDTTIGSARKRSIEEHGNDDVSMSPVLNNTQGFLDETAPIETAGGTIQGPTTPAERAALERYQKIMRGSGDDTMKFSQLQKLADEIKTQADLGKQAIAPGAKETRGQGFLNSLYGQIKGVMHQIDPELAAADARYADYSNKADRLGKLEDEDQMESFINNYFGKNKTLMRESAQELIPQSVEDIADIGASRAFTRQGPAGSEMGKRAIGSGGAAAGLTLSGHPGLAAIVYGATSPQVHKAVIGNASKAIDALKGMPWFQAIQKNPALLETISNPSLRQAVQSALGGMEAAPAVGERVDSPMLRDHGSDREPAFDPSGPLIHGDEARRQFLEGN